MGCVSSKLFARYRRQENNRYRNRVSYTSHVVSLTSTTYGVLNLDKENDQHHHQTQTTQEIEENAEEHVEKSVVDSKKSSPCREEEPSEIINAWELMEGLEEEASVAIHQSKESPKSRPLTDPKSPKKLSNHMGSPRKGKRVWGKENQSGRLYNVGIKSLENTPNAVLKESNNYNNLSQCVRKPSPILWASIKGSRGNNIINNKTCGDSLRIDSRTFLSRGRRSLSPFFDPELAASFEKEVYEQREDIKKMVSVSSNPQKDQTFRGFNAILESYEKKCPPGGENSVVLYTTTLRSIRKTFDDCNVARKIIESQNVRMLERDVSMHSGYKEEIRELMGTKEVKVPLAFVKGKLIGGAEEMLRLDEEGKLGILLVGIPKAKGVGCKMCAGIRFMMCWECNGSRKLLSGDGRKNVKCNKCNENGLIQCPLCVV